MWSIEQTMQPGYVNILANPFHTPICENVDEIYAAQIVKEHNLYASLVEALHFAQGYIDPNDPRRASSRESLLQASNRIRELLVLANT